jgi:hypothetical protein
LRLADRGQHAQGRRERFCAFHSTSGVRPIATQAWLTLNVSTDPIIDAGHRARCGYRCGGEAATGDGENARLGYAYTDHRGLVTAS